MCAEAPIFVSGGACAPGTAGALSPSDAATANRIVSAALLRLVRFTFTRATTGSLLPVPPTWLRRPARHCTRDAANTACARSRPSFDATARCGEADWARGARSRHTLEIDFARRFPRHE